MTTYSDAKPNEGIYAPAYQRMQRALERGGDRYDELLRVVAATTITDRLVDPKYMRFVQGPLGCDVRLDYRNGVEPYTIHDHALQALSKTAGVKIDYVRSLLAPAPEGETPTWRSHLLCHIFNEHFRQMNFGQKGDPRFLHRIVGSQLRGFLSRRFNRHLASTPMLRAFAAACSEAGAVPFDARATDLKFYLKCYVPQVFEPVPGEFVAVGVEWSNSDFGDGPTKVCSILWRASGADGGHTVLDTLLKKIHIGPVLHDRDVQDVEISEDTAKKEASTQASFIADAVRHHLAPERVGRLLAAIEAAHQDQIPWNQLKGRLGKILTKKEVEEIEKMQGFEELPPIQAAGEPLPTRWWASAAVARLAKSADSKERAAELERASGALLGVEKEAA